ncbi:MAG: hypothetical protein Q9170_004871 [Blastenia crenularia]
MLGKRKSTRSVAPIKKRRKGEPLVEEITFDFSAREEYLTGFHKRKLQRVKHAKEEALKKEREEKVASRKALRESRRIDRENNVEAINAAVRDAEGHNGSDESGDDSGEQWKGLAEPTNIDHEDDYLDEDRHTIVTVEAVDISRDGLRRLEESGSGSEDDQKQPTHNSSKTTNRGPLVNGGAEGNGKRSKPFSSSESRPKKKKKFRYESKAERKVTRFKERMGGKAKAKARRE